MSRNGMYHVKEMLKEIVTLREERVSRNDIFVQESASPFVTLREERVSRNDKALKGVNQEIRSRSARSV